MSVKYPTLEAIAEAEFDEQIDVNSVAHILGWPLYRTRWELKRANIEIMLRDDAIKVIARRNPEAVVSMAAALHELSKDNAREKRFNELLTEKLK